jgi:hypothetical protein
MKTNKMLLNLLTMLTLSICLFMNTSYAAHFTVRSSAPYCKNDFKFELDVQHLGKEDHLPFGKTFSVQDAVAKGQFNTGEAWSVIQVNTAGHIEGMPLCHFDIESNEAKVITFSQAGNKCICTVR